MFDSREVSLPLVTIRIPLGLLAGGALLWCIKLRGRVMKKLPLILLFLASAATSTNAWSDTEIIDFEGVIEEFDVGSNGLPTRIETQGYTFYSSGGIGTGGGVVGWCPAPGCKISLYGDNLNRLISLDVHSANFPSGSGTIEVVGEYWDDPDRLETSAVVLPFGPSSTTHTIWSGLISDEDWQALEWVSIHIETNTGGPVALDNIVIDTGRRNVEIDVLPGDEANVVYPNKAGKLPIAILSSAEFDATQVYVSGMTINQQPHVAELVGVENVDGLHGPDLVTQFSVQSSAIFCDDTEVSITGYTSNGEYISGTGAIDATECESGSCHPY